MTDYAEVLYEALAAEFGLALRTKYPARLVQRFYLEQRRHPQFNSLGFIQKEHEVWIVHRPSDTPQSIKADNYLSSLGLEIEDET